MADIRVGDTDNDNHTDTDIETVGQTGADRAWLASRLPPVLAGGRFGLSAGAAAGLCLIALLAVIGGGILLIRSQAHPVSLASSAAGSDVGSGSDPGGSGSDSSSGSPYGAQGRSTAVAVPSPSGVSSIEVDVVGKVHTAGVYRLLPGARVGDALAAAGGALSGVDLTSLDLASRVQDGDQIRVGLASATTAGASSVVGGGSAAGAGAPTAPMASIGPGNPLDLNAATASQLDELPGVGPTTAAKIIAWRDAHGPFSSVAGLGQIPGFSARRLATLTPLLRT